MTETFVDVTGSLMPDESVNLSAEVPGTLARVLVDFGQAVKKGQVVAELDTRELRMAVERSRALLRQAYARIGLTPEQDASAATDPPAVRQARAQYEDARSKFDSAARLMKSGDIAQERYTELEKTAQSRKAALDAAQDDLRMQLASIDQLKFDVSLAQKRLGDASIRAPFDGEVAEKLISAGQFVKENTAVVRVVKTWPLRLRAEIPEAMVSEARVGTAVTFTTDAVAGQEYRAIIRELNPSLDPRSRSRTAEARIERADSRLRAGMFVQVRVAGKKVESIVVPKRAVYSVAGLTKVYAVRGGRVVEIKVVPGQALGEWVVVSSSQLKVGDVVATNQTAQLVNGAKVTVKG